MRRRRKKHLRRYIRGKQLRDQELRAFNSQRGIDEARLQEKTLWQQCKEFLAKLIDKAMQIAISFAFFYYYNYSVGTPAVDDNEDRKQSKPSFFDFNRYTIDRSWKLASIFITWTITIGFSIIGYGFVVTMICYLAIRGFKFLRAAVLN